MIHIFAGKLCRALDKLLTKIRNQNFIKNLHQSNYYEQKSSIT
jgi:hypothetical protein